MVPVGGLVYYISPPTSLTEVSAAHAVSSAKASCRRVDVFGSGPSLDLGLILGLPYLNQQSAAPLCHSSCQNGCPNLALTWSMLQLLAGQRNLGPCWVGVV